jgi:hypothetical protein
MTYLYLRYRASLSDPWTTPSTVAPFPVAPAGALPVHSVRIETGPQVPTGCCSTMPIVDDHLILKAQIAPLPLTTFTTLMKFLLLFKTAAYREAKMVRFGNGNFMPSDLSLVTGTEDNGTTSISLRLAASFADATAPCAMISYRI